MEGLLLFALFDVSTEKIQGEAEIKTSLHDDSKMLLSARLIKSCTTAPGWAQILNGSIFYFSLGDYRELKPKVSAIPLWIIDLGT